MAKQDARIAMLKGRVRRRVIGVAPRRQDLAVLVGVEPCGAERVPALVAELAALAAHRRHGPVRYRFRVVLFALARCPDPVEVHDPFRFRDVQLGTEPDAQVVDLTTTAVGHVVVDPRNGIAVGLLGTDRHLREPHVLEQPHAAVAHHVGVEPVRNAVAVGIGVDRQQHDAVFGVALVLGTTRVGRRVRAIRQAVAVYVAIRYAVAVRVHGKHQILAGLFEVLVDAVAVLVVPVQFVAAEGAGESKGAGSVREGPEGVAGVVADGDRDVLAVAAATVPLVQTAGNVAGVVVHRRYDDLALDLEVVVQGVLEVAHALLLVTLFADVLPVGQNLTAVVAVAAGVAFRSLPVRDAAVAAEVFALAGTCGHEPIEEATRLIEVRVAQAPDMVVVGYRLVGIVAVRIDGITHPEVVVPGTEGIAAARVGPAPDGMTALVVAEVPPAEFLVPDAVDLVPTVASIGN